MTILPLPMQLTNQDPPSMLDPYQYLLEQIIQQMPFPVAVTGTDGFALVVNKAFLELLSLPSADLLIGKFNVFTDPWVHHSGLLEKILAAYRGETVFVPEVEVDPSDLDPKYQISGELFCHDITFFPVLNEAGQVWRVVTILKDASERRQGQLELKRRLLELEALHAVAMAGTEAADVDDLIERVTAILHEKLHPENFGIALYDEESRTLTYHPSSFSIEEEDVPGQRIALDQGITGVVARTRKPRLVPDVRLDPDYIGTNPAILSALCVPISIGSRLIGVINAEKTTLDAFSVADECLLSAVAGELGTAIEKIRLLEAEWNRGRELEAVSAVSAAVREAETLDEMLPAVLERISDVLGLQGAAVAFKDPRDDAMVFELGIREWETIQGIRMPPGSGVGSQVIRTQQLYLSSDAWNDPNLFRRDFIGSVKSLICLPLVARGATIGLLYLGRAQPFQPSEVRLARATGDIAASAIYRVQLNEQTERQMERLKGLRAIDEMILSSLDIDRTLEVLLEKITCLLNIDAAEIMLLEPGTNQLRGSAQRGLPVAPTSELRLELEESIANNFILSREMQFVQDLEPVKATLPEPIRLLVAPFSSYITIPLVAREKMIGVLHLFNSSRLDPTPDWFYYLQMLAGQAAIAIDNAQLFEEQQQTNLRLLEAYDSTIEGWSRALDLRDQETEGHSRRVTELTLKLARRLGIPEEKLAFMRRGAQLHDIGKMGIPDEILYKPGPLNEVEWAVMRKHPVYAVEFLHSIEFLRPALEIPHCHHEKWDGTGYPLGLKGEEIPLSARIFALADVWDALTSDRPYRSAWSKEKTLQYLREQSGKHFDPHILPHFLEMMAEELPDDGVRPSPLAA